MFRRLRLAYDNKTRAEANCGEYRQAAEFIASAVGQERRKSGWAAAIKEKGLRRLSNRTGALICPLRKSFGGNFATYLILAWQATGWPLWVRRFCVA
jgi:hypothetical protein